ncbi:hypothetical protein PV327_008920 [Microctonus hyperodae]|uniref:Uncharacterized protein n=1 Tax=Microctonus hyperodae TaxID=165561 RepID=A0AA39FT00_MICHY|nr:hypothetical protein PV327_008920 [Microctonus hyperodae]
MASIVELFGAICFISLQLVVFLNSVQGGFLKSVNNATDHESSWTSGRLKRSLADVMPNKLEIQIQYEMQDVEYVTLVKTSQKLANLHLPVDAPANYFFRDTVMNDIGEFVMYQDLARSSAIVYFEKLKAIFGVFGTDYYIFGCPLQWDENGMVLEAVKSPYLVKREGIPFQLGPNVFTHNEINNVQGTHEMDRNHEQIMNPQAGPSTRPDSIQEHGGGMSDDRNKKCNEKYGSVKYYLETLVFISKGVTDIFCNVFKDDCINEIVRYYLVYFNAVDLFFRKLKLHGMDISINIAKIVIEDVGIGYFDQLNHV